MSSFSISFLDNKSLSSKILCTWIWMTQDVSIELASRNHSSEESYSILSPKFSYTVGQKANLSSTACGRSLFCNAHRSISEIITFHHTLETRWWFPSVGVMGERLYNTRIGSLKDSNDDNVIVELSGEEEASVHSNHSQVKTNAISLHIYMDINKWLLDEWLITRLINTCSAEVWCRPICDRPQPTSCAHRTNLLSLGCIYPTWILLKLSFGARSW